MKADLGCSTVGFGVPWALTLLSLLVSGCDDIQGHIFLFKRKVHRVDVAHRQEMQGHHIS